MCSNCENDPSYSHNDIKCRWKRVGSYWECIHGIRRYREPKGAPINVY